MLRWLIVAHVNPRDAVDREARPNRLKVTRAIPRDAAERVLEKVGQDIGPYLEHVEEGYVLCYHDLAPRPLRDQVYDFAFALADQEGAVLMDESHNIWLPGAARDAQTASWRELGID